MPTTTDRDRLLALARARGFFTARDAVAAGIHSSQLAALLAEGMLERVARGRYRFADADVTERHGFAVASAVAPDAVVCLLSALNFHEIGTQLPAEVWLAVERGRRTPKLRSPRLRVVHFSGAAFHEGIEVHRIESRPVRIYSVAKTLADLFKTRYDVGLDVALEALHDAWRHRRFVMADLDRAARACRVERVMRPYIEAVVA